MSSDRRQPGAGAIDDEIGIGAEQHAWLHEDPYRGDAYRSLFQLYVNARRLDEAWCVAATLSFLLKASPTEQRFHEQHRPQELIQPRLRMNDEHWTRDLFHPEEEEVVGKLFEAITPAALRRKAYSDRELKLKRRDELTDIATSNIRLVRAFVFATQVLGLPFLPRLFVCPDREGGLTYATAMPPTSVCGRALLQGVESADLVFAVARHLAYYRPEHYIRTLFQSRDELRLVLLAGMRIAGADIRDSTVSGWATDLNDSMYPADRELLGHAARRLMEHGGQVDLDRWIKAVDLTSCRAGFLLANSLSAAQRMLQLEARMDGDDATPREKMEDLLRFSVSERYFRLRKALGIQLVVP